MQTNPTVLSEFHNMFTLINIRCGLVFTISDYFSCRIAFLNPIQETLRSVSVYTSSVTIFCANMISFPPSYLLFSLHIFQAIDQFICVEAILSSKLGLGAFHIGLRCLDVKQNGTDCTGFIFVPCQLLMRSRVVPDCWSRILDSYRAV